MRYNKHTTDTILQRAGWYPVEFSYHYTTYERAGEKRYLFFPRKGNTPYSTRQWDVIKKTFDLTPEDLHAPER